MREKLRGDFAAALSACLLENERVEGIFAIRGDALAGQRLPSVALTLTQRALLVLREPETRIRASLGIRTALLPFRSLGGIEFGHSLLLGSLLIRLFGNATVVPRLGVYDIRGGFMQVYYHALDEPALADFVRRLRELAGL